MGNQAVVPLTFTFTYDTRPPIISTSIPAAGETVTSPIEKLTVTLSDSDGSGVDITNSMLKVFKRIGGQPSVTVPGAQSDDSVNTLVWTFDSPLASDGTDDGIYQIEVISQDTLGNTSQNQVEPRVTFEFTYTVRAPSLVSTTPERNVRLNETLNQVVAVLRDRSGSGLDVTKSILILRKTGFGNGLSEVVPGVSQLQLTDAFDPLGSRYTLTFTLDAGLAIDGNDDGVYSIDITAVDNAGSTARYPIDFVYDTGAPRVVQVFPDTGTVLNTTINMVSAQLDDAGTEVELANSTIRLTRPGAEIEGRQTNDGHNTINREFAPLETDGSADGVYTITVVAVDTLGNRAFIPFESQFTLDTTPPGVEDLRLKIEDLEESVSIFASPSVERPFSIVEVVLTDEGVGIDIERSTVRLLGPTGNIPGQQSSSAGASARDAIVSFQLDSGLADDGSVDGTYTVEVISQDLLGNRSDPLTFAFAYRSKTPLLTDVTPQDGAELNASIEMVSARLKDQSGTGLNLDVSSLTVVGPGVAPDDIQSNNGVDTFFWTFANPLATDGSDDGTYTTTIVGEPNIGGRATYTTTFTYDTTPPVVVSTIPSEGTILVTGISEVSVILTDANTQVDLRRSTLQLSGPGGRVTGRQTDNGVDTLQLTFDALNIDGEYSLIIQPSDTLGNTPATANRFQFVLDTTPPSIVTTEPQAGATLVVPIDQVSVTLNDAGAGVDIEQSTVRLLGPNGFVVGTQLSSYSQAENRKEAIFNFQLEEALSTDGDDDGTYEIVVSPIDIVGNETEEPFRFSFAYTTRAPGIASTTPEPDAVLNTSLERVSVVLQDNSGTGIDFAQSQILLLGPGGPVNGTMENDEQRTLTLILDNPLAIDGQDDGEYTLKTTAFDQTEAQAEYTQTFTYDTVPPKIKDLRLRVDDSDEGVSIFDTESATINSQFSAVEAVLADKGVGIELVESTIQLSGGRGRVSGVATNNGVDTIRWEFQPIPTDGTADGVYTVTVIPRDRVGNLGAETSVQFTYDTTAPHVISTSPKADSVIVTSIDRIAVVLDDGTVGTGIDFAISTVSLSGPNGNIPGVQTHDELKTIFFSFAPLALDDTAKGDYQITVILQDRVGNQGEALTFSFTYQPTAPILAETQPEDGEKLSVPPKFIRANLTDQSGIGVNFDESLIQLIGPTGLVDGVLTNDGGGIMRLTFSRFLATDGTDDGDYTIRIISQDNRGNRATYSIGFLYDTTPPEVISTLPADGDIFNTGLTRVVASLADAHAGIDLTQSLIRLTGPSGGTIRGTQQNNGLDTIQLHFATPVPAPNEKGIGDGVYTITVIPADVLGNSTSESFLFRFRIDTTAPSVVKTEPADGTVLVNTPLTQVSIVLDDGQNGTGIDLNRTTLQLSGLNGNVPGRLNREEDSASTSTTEETLAFIFDAPLSLDGSDDGRYTITVEAFDNAENRTETHQTTFVYDTVQPGGPVIQNISVQPVAFSPNGDGASDTTSISYILSKSATVTIRVTDESFNIVRTLMDGEALGLSEQLIVWDGTGSSGGTILPDGTYTVTLDARDANGLTSTLESVNVEIDTQPPILSNLTVSDNPFTPDGDGFKDLLRFQFTVANASPRDNVVITFHDALGDQIAVSAVSPRFVGNGTYSAIWDGEGALHDGEYQYSIRARDSAANVRLRSGTIALDREGPTVTIVEPASDGSPLDVVTNQTPLRLSGNVTDFSGVRKMEILVRQGDSPVLVDSQNIPLEPTVVGAPQIDNPDLLVFDYQFDPPDDGTYTFTVRATDNVGHVASPELIEIIYDTTDPQHLETLVEVGSQSEPRVPPQKVKNGDVLQLTTRWDAASYHLTVDFSQLDTQFKGEVIGVDKGDGEYLVTYRISDGESGAETNQASDGLKTIHITAIDSATNTTTVDVVAFELDNTAPRIENIRSLDPDEIYRNGETIKILVTSDASNLGITADFSGIDQKYQPNTENITDHGDNTYTIEYQILEDNPLDFRESRPVIISVSDGVHTTVDRSFTVQLDNLPPTFASVVATEEIYSNGETVVLTVTLDAAGLILTADFSEIDSTYSEGSETVTDNGDKTYTVKYLIRGGNAKGDVKNASIRLKARDLAGNLTVNQFTVTLDNLPPEVQSVLAIDPDDIYKNGDTINLLIEADSAGYAIVGDFSFVDSTYKLESETVTDRGDGTYRVTYTISDDNAKAVGETHKNLPVHIIVSDAVHTTTFDEFTINLDNQPPIVEITSPDGIVNQLTPFSTTSAEIDIQGKTEPQGSVTVSPVPIVIDYDSATGEFSFKVALNPGENLVEIQVTDIAGNKTVKELKIRFNQIISSVISAATGGTLILPEETDDGIPNNDTKLTIPPGALISDAEVAITRVTDELPPADHADIPPDTFAPRVAYRIVLKDTSGQEIPGVTKKPVTLVLQFPSRSETASPAAPQQTRGRGELVSIFKWDGVHWNNFGGKVQSNNTVSISTNQADGLFAVFPITAAPQTFKVSPPRPNPFTPNDDGIHDFVIMYFDNPGELSPTVRIYDIRGVLVRELHDVGLTSAVWDGRDDGGRVMPLGLYLYQVEAGDQTAGGTIALAR